MLIHTQMKTNLSIAKNGCMSGFLRFLDFRSDIVTVITVSHLRILLGLHWKTKKMLLLKVRCMCQEVSMTAAQARMKGLAGRQAGLPLKLTFSCMCRMRRLPLTSTRGSPIIYFPPSSRHGDAHILGIFVFPVLTRCCVQKNKSINVNIKSKMCMYA